MSLRVLDEIIALSPRIRQVVRTVKPHSKELSEQLDRAWTRVVSNTAEAASRRGRNKGRNRFDDALGEAKESHGLLRYVFAAEKMPPEPELLRRVDGVAAVLWTLANRS